MPELPEGLTLTDITEMFTVTDAEYALARRKAITLDATDKGKLWKNISAKFPSYQILPDTNHVAYVKSNLLASLYSVGRSASITPTSEMDKQMTKDINIMLDYLWDVLDIPYYQMLAGERAALLNIGITRVGWDTELNGGMPAVVNIDPLRYMRDPFAESLDYAGWVITWDYFHKSIMASDPKYKDTFQPDTTVSSDWLDSLRQTDKANTAKKDYYKVITYFIRHQGKIYEVHTMDNKYVLYVDGPISPNIMPFAELYCNVPNGDLFGSSEPSKVFANSVAYNIMNSIILTSDYKNQRPPRFVNVNSQLDLRSFIKNGNDSDYTFTVQGDASRAVHYQQFPQVSAQSAAILGRLGMDIQTVTGVDGRYTGKNTGSVITTGGMEAMLDQATTIDQPKIVNYERYSKQLTKLVLANLSAFGAKRTYYVKDVKKKEIVPVTVDFMEVPDGVSLNYSLNISLHLPKNRERVARMATEIMQMQMQYAQSGTQVNLITPEEWLMLQDIPMQEYMLERMGLERSTDYVEQVSSIVFQYADLLEQGIKPEDAIYMTADTLAQSKGLSQPT